MICNIHIQKSRDLEFLNEISRPRVFKWNLETSSSEMKSRDLEMLNEISRPRVLKWNLETSILKWNLEVSVFMTFKWNLNPESSVFKWNLNPEVSVFMTFN